MTNRVSTRKKITSFLLNHNIGFFLQQVIDVYISMMTRDKSNVRHTGRMNVYQNEIRLRVVSRRSDFFRFEMKIDEKNFDDHFCFHRSLIFDVKVSEE